MLPKNSVLNFKTNIPAPMVILFLFCVNLGISCNNLAKFRNQKKLRDT